MQLEAREPRSLLQLPSRSANALVCGQRHSSALFLSGARCVVEESLVYHLTSYVRHSGSWPHLALLSDPNNEWGPLVWSRWWRWYMPVICSRLCGGYGPVVSRSSAALHPFLCSCPFIRLHQRSFYRYDVELPVHPSVTYCRQCVTGSRRDDGAVLQTVACSPVVGRVCGDFIAFRYASMLYL